jgi:hypothetical protein
MIKKLSENANGSKRESKPKESSEANLNDVIAIACGRN